jgi:hypothetical protein
MTHIFQGKCKCGNTSIILTMPKPLNQYTPRACDCDFCSTNKISYLSDPLGVLVIESKLQFKHEKQGSNQAEFLSCSNCNQVFAVVVAVSKSILGAVNIECLNDTIELLSTESASPKLLSPVEKIKRWEQVWCKIRFEGNTPKILT